MWSLATELFADRGALQVTGCLETTVASLVKTCTGLPQVSGKNYLAQAEEIFSKSKPRTDQLTHPETFMRARSLQLWAEDSADLDETVSRMLEEDDGVDGLDLIQQVELAKLTRRFLDTHLRPDWFRSDAVLAHARLFFPDFAPAEADDEGLPELLAKLSKPREEYLCQVMLDFCAVDTDLEEMPVAAGIERARELGCLGHFKKLAARELKWKPKDFKKLKEKAADLLANAPTGQA